MRPKVSIIIGELLISLVMYTGFELLGIRYAVITSGYPRCHSGFPQSWICERFHHRASRNCSPPVEVSIINLTDIMRLGLRPVATGLIHLDTARAMFGVEGAVQISTTSKTSHQYNGLSWLAEFCGTVIEIRSYLLLVEFLLSLSLSQSADWLTPSPWKLRSRISRWHVLWH